MAQRLGLIFLSLWVAFLVGSSLYGSWKEPQPQGAISLYQTNLTLQALEWEGLAAQSEEVKEAVFGQNPVGSAITQYGKVKASILSTTPSLSATLEADKDVKVSKKDLQSRESLDQLNLSLGILESSLGHDQAARAYWKEIEEAPYTSAQHRQLQGTVAVLTAQNGTDQPLSDRETILRNNLSGWFQTQSLETLFEAAGNEAELAALQTQKEKQAISAIERLLVAVGLPLIGSIAGLILLIVWGINTTRSFLGVTNQSPEDYLKPDQPTENSPEISPSLGLAVPWSFDTFWLTMLLWFFAFFAVSLVIPLSLQLTFGEAITATARGQSLLALANYSGLVVAGLGLLTYMTQKHIDNFFQWLPIQFKGAWVKWGLGGYVAALPLVLAISLINQKLIGEKGGGNPLLDIILQTHDIGTWFILLVMVSVLAPIFEEIVFRGFALTSLSRYLPIGGAIATSAALFAVAHLNIADFLPLFVLGSILGTIYTQSRNLLSSILLHSRWNGAQLIELLYLSGN